MTDPNLNDAVGEMPTTPPPRATRLLAVGVLVIVALAGVLGGVALERTVLRPHRWAERAGTPRGDRRGAPRRPSAMMPAELKLSAAQATRIDTLIEGQMRGFREIRRSTQPAIDSLMAQTRRSIDSILTPTQRAQLDSAHARREAAMKRRFPDGTPNRGAADWPRPPGPGPGPSGPRP